MDYGIDKQIAIQAARLEMRTSWNYGTGNDLMNPFKFQDILDAKKSTIPDTAPDQLYIVTKLH